MSELFKLSKQDWIKGALIALLTALLTGVYNGIETGTFAFTWFYFKPIVLSSFGAMLAYIIKNVLTNSKGELLTKE